ncbi:MAG: SDR family NAD(P)-dependent oxidoreductase [Oligoflexia bacterium]|nr:SDR family NAD(P)-dependent oxidoreductase [Oligoflexia bacterium]
MNTKSAIVTGGLGFIGSHLVDLLIDHGFKVIVLDNASTGRISNLQKHLNNSNLYIVNVDITFERDIKKLEMDTRIDVPNVKYIFHLAGLADIVPSIERPADYHNANVNGTFNILSLAREWSNKYNQLEKFVYAASSSCYGLASDTSNTPTNENATIDPQYPYALSKNIGEQYVIHYGRIYKLPTISLRLFNVFGPRSRTTGTYGAVFGIFLKQKLEGKAYTIVGDGKQARDFIFVSDVANAFWSAANSNSNVCSQIFNVGSGNCYSINMLADLLGGERVYIPKRPGEPDKTHADISKIKNIIGWQPQISFEEGVKRVLENIDYWRDAPLWDTHSIAKATDSWFRYLQR